MDRLEEVTKERDYWRTVAAYLASCSAATAEYDGQLSGVSNARKRRYAGLCEKAALAMQGDFRPTTSTDTEQSRARCVDAIRALGFEVPPVLKPFHR